MFRKGSIPESSSDAMSGARLRKEPTPKKTSKYVICELYSRPRMCAQAQTHKLKGGWSIYKDVQDPVTGRVYDVRNRKDQNEVRKMIRRDRPLALTVSPPCTLFSVSLGGEIFLVGPISRPTSTPQVQYRVLWHKAMSFKS